MPTGGSLCDFHDEVTGVTVATPLRETLIAVLKFFKNPPGCVFEFDLASPKYPVQSVSLGNGTAFYDLE
jgi:hypothetical protein